MKALRTYLSCAAGTATIEAAFIVPVFVAAGLGIFDSSSLLRQTQIMDSQLSIAAKFLAQSPSPNDAELSAKRLTVTGTLADGGTPMIVGWSVNDITISYAEIENTSQGSRYLYRGGDMVRVVKLSSSLAYDGFGPISAISKKSVIIHAEHEERITAGYE